MGFDINSEINVGDGVSLRFGFFPPTLMTVVGCEAPPRFTNDAFFICRWHDKDGKPQSEIYPRSSLYRNQGFTQKINNLVHCFVYLSDGTLIETGSYGTHDPAIIPGYNAPSNQSPVLPTPGTEKTPLEMRHEEKLAEIAAGKDNTMPDV